MTNTHYKPERTGPLWAVFGAPLVGVPVMVALLALGSGPTVDAAVERDVGISVEQVDTPEGDASHEAEDLRSD